VPYWLGYFLILEEQAKAYNESEELVSPVYLTYSKLHVTSI